MSINLQVEPHPLLEHGWIEAQFSGPIGSIASSSEVVALMQPGAQAPMSTNDDLRKAVRDLLRHGGYKPTGRGKPSSEYLHGVWQASALPVINAAVDLGNMVSLHSGLPISVVDLARTEGALSLALAGQGASYVFNASGQTIELEGLLCLFDGAGPCANAVKDAQRTKTSTGTTRTLSVIWGTRQLPGRTAEAVRWYANLLAAAGATVRASHE